MRSMSSVAIVKADILREEAMYFGKGRYSICGKGRYFVSVIVISADMELSAV